MTPRRAAVLAAVEADRGRWGALGKVSQESCYRTWPFSFSKAGWSGEEKEGKKTLTTGHWLSDWCFISLMSFNYFTNYKGWWWWYLIEEPFPLSSCFQASITDLSSLTVLPPEEAVPSSHWWGAKALHPTGPLFFSQLTWSHRVPVSSSCFGSDLILWSPLSSLLILNIFFILKSSCLGQEKSFKTDNCDILGIYSDQFQQI